MENQIDLARYLTIFRRRWMYFVIPAILVALAGLAYAYVLPPVYEARATILIESQQIPTDLASPTVTADAAERIRVIEQRLLARDNLLEVANKYALFRYLGAEASPTQIVENVRQSVRIAQIDTVRGSAARIVGFTVSFQYRDASTAARVANELVTSILAQNVATRLNRASETSGFFAQQKSGLEQRLLELEGKIAEYKRTNETDLPETLAVRREQLARLRLQLGEMEQTIRIANASAEGIQALDGNSAVQQLSYRLQAKQLELDDFQKRLAELRPLAESGVVPTNRIRDLERQIAVAELDIKAIEAQIENAGGVGSGPEALKLLSDQRSEIQAQIDSLSESILRTPLVEVELNAMSRDYANLQAEYRLAQTRLENAQVGERLEQDRQSERFEVIEQASVPEQPSSPNRPRIMMAGAGGGVAAGIALLVFRQMLDRAVYSASDIERALQLRPISVIPRIGTRRDKRSTRIKWAFLLTMVVVLVAAGLYAIDTYYLPLDLLLQRVGERAHGWLSARGLIR